MLIPFSPYQDDGPSTQRHYWFHSEIISYNYQGQVTDRVSGVLVTLHDAYSTERVLPALRQKGINLSTRTNWKEDCNSQTYCNLPLFRVRFGTYLKDSLFLSTGPPAPFNPDPSIGSTRNCVGESCTFNFTMTGPAHNLITLWPRANVNLTAWSFSMPIKHTFTQLNRPVYVIIHSTPTYSERFAPLVFTVDAIIPLSQQSQPVIDVSLHAHKIHHPEDYTAEYRNIVNNVPKYFNIASNLSIRKNYVF
ncbi:hypothetical protein O0L34_g3322 [Tuta absoluta]|nr:hypothetical protein O0L34_g3322 [Tuta absoluta]